MYYVPWLLNFKMKADRAPIAEELFEDASDLEFGTQEVQSLQLLERCSSGEKGYYFKIAEVELGAGRVEKHEERYWMLYN